MRRYGDFIEAFLEYTENSESAERLRLWAGISTVAAALERRTFLTWGHTTLYPNLYVVIVAPSGARKGEPMVVARDLMSNTNVTLAAERITDEALLKFIAESEDSFNIGSEIKFQCAVTVVGEELAVLLRNKDISFMADLTALYDCRDDWKYQTKGSGTDEIHGGCLNILVSTAPDWLPTIIPPEAVGGGFTSRCFFIVESKKGKVVPDPNLTMPDPQKRENLIHDLEMIMSLSGEFRFSQAGYDFYIQWYKKQEEEIEKGNMPVDDPKLYNYASRRATHVKKLGMVISASRSDSLVIEQNDLVRALDMMLEIEKDMASAFKTVGHSKNAAVMDTILETIKQMGTASKASVMRVVQRDLDPGEFSQIEMSLEQMGYIKRVVQPGGDTYFKYIPQD